MSHRLRAGFLFESLLSFKEKKIKPSTCYIHLSEHLMYQLMMLLYKKKAHQLLETAVSYYYFLLCSGIKVV